MILQSTDALEEHIGNKYSLVIVAAKRARQLKEGHTPLVADPSTENFLSHALKEIEDHRVQSVAPPEEELAPAPRDVIASLVAGTDFDMDEDVEDTDAVDDLAALLLGADDEDDESEADDDGLAVTARAEGLTVQVEDETEEDDTEDATEDEEIEDEEEEEDPALDEGDEEEEDV
jgi:DNA-directed RNA polymerase omega subunit